MHDVLPQAFLVHQNKVYIADESHSSTHDTPVTLLIKRVCENFPHDSRRILRERIFVSSALTPFCQGMIKVVAKRASVLDVDEFRVRYLSLLRTHGVEVITPLTPEGSMRSHSQGSQNATRSFSNFDQIAEYALNLATYSERAISAVLIDYSGKLLGSGLNSNLEIRTEHAEMNLIRNLIRDGMTEFPNGSKLLVTLKPCAMCAAAILKFSNPAFPVSVVYLKDDPGPKAKRIIGTQPRGLNFDCHE